MSRTSGDVLSRSFGVPEQDIKWTGVSDRPIIIPHEVQRDPVAAMAIDNGNRGHCQSGTSRLGILSAED